MNKCKKSITDGYVLTVDLSIRKFVINVGMDVLVVDGKRRGNTMPDVRQKRDEVYIALGTMMCIIGVYLMHSSDFNIRGTGVCFIYCGAAIHGYYFGR